MNPGTIVIMAVMSLTGILGLFIASRAVDTGMHLFGFVLFALAIFLDFWLINRHFDEAAVAD